MTQASTSTSNSLRRTDSIRPCPSLRILAGVALAAVCLLTLYAGPASATDYTVKPDGSGDFSTIQACANSARAGDKCVVYAGRYDEHVKTAGGGTGDGSRIIFKAQGIATMKGFDIQHPYVSVEGFDITGYAAAHEGHINVFGDGSYCHISKNTIRDGLANVYGIYFTLGGTYPSHCEIRANTLSNLRHHFLNITGDSHLVAGNTFQYQNDRDFIRLFASNSMFSRNMFWQAGDTSTGFHGDVVQTWGDSAFSVENNLFEENWIEGLNSQLGMLVSADGSAYSGKPLYGTVKNLTFRRNVIIDLAYNTYAWLPGVRFENNTFYLNAHALGGIYYEGTLTRGEGSSGYLASNVFLAGGSSPSTRAGSSGFYALGRGTISPEVLSALVTLEGYPHPIADGVVTELQTRGYIDADGAPLAAAKALTDISRFTMGATYASYKPSIYAILLSTVALDTRIATTFYADYNFVAGASAAGYPAKSVAGCGSGFPIGSFCELHGINGGDPRLIDVARPRGADGLPFTLDDGLKPTVSSPLCARGQSGVDIGAYSCDPAKLFSSGAGPKAPVNLRIR